MQEQNYNKLVSAVAEVISEQPYGSVWARVERAFSDAVDRGEILTLSIDEVDALKEFRIFKKTGNSVFHYKR